MIGLSLAISAFLVFLNGIFVGYEFAILKSSPYHLESLAVSGHRGASLGLRHKKRANEYLAVCQLGITAVTLALTVSFEPAVEAIVAPWLPASLSDQAAHGVSLGIALFVATSIHVTFGELIPKSIALITPERLVSRTAGMIDLLARVARAPIWFFNGISTSLARRVTGKPVQVESEEIDVQQELRSSRQSGKIDEIQFELLDAVLDFPELIAREVMTPRADLIYIDPAHPTRETLLKLTRNRYTRYPVISDGQVKGYVLIHDLFAAPDPHNIQWERVTRPIPKIPETLRLPRVNKGMRQSPIAAVFDEYNEFVGIITQTDIQEEIMGEILDEDDEESLPLIDKAADGSYVLNAEKSAEDLLDALGIQTADHELEGVDSFGGLLLAYLGREPKEGDEVDWAGFRFRVEATDRFRITRVRAWTLDDGAQPIDTTLNDGGDGE